MHNRQSLDTLFPNISVWEATTDGFKVRAAPGSEHYLRDIGDGELAGIDKDLPDGIRMLVQVHDLVLGLQIKQMLAFWKNPVCVEATDGRQVHLSHIQEMRMTSRFVRFTARGHVVLNQAVPGVLHRTVCIPVRSATKITTVARDWLDIQYPGWLKRVEIAKLLDDDDNAAIACIFVKPPAPCNTSLPLDLV